MLKKRILIGLTISIIQVALFYLVFLLLTKTEGLLGFKSESTPIANAFLQLFFDLYFIAFATIIILQNTLIVITWRKKWTLALRVISSVIHLLFWLDSMEAVYSESIIMASTGLILIWLGPIIESLLIKGFNIKHPYRERDYYEDLNVKKEQ